MTKETFSDLASMIGATAAINGIVSEIEIAFDNTLSRDGSAPNQMLTSLDMNSNRILNLPLPLANTEPARLIDIFNYLTFPSGSDRESLIFKREGAPVDQTYWRLSTGPNGEPGIDLLDDTLSATQAFSISRSGANPVEAEFFSPLLLTNKAAPVGDQTALWRTDTGGTLIGGMHDDLGQEWQWLNVGRNLHIPFAATFFVPINVNTLSNIGVINFNRTNAPGGTPGPLQSGDYIGQLNFQGYAQTQSSTYVNGLSAIAEENWTDTANGSAAVITATPSGKTVPIQMMLWSPTYGIVAGRSFDENPVALHEHSQPTVTLSRSTAFTGGEIDWDANTMWTVNTVGANNSYSERVITASLNNYSATGLNNLNGALIGESVKYGAGTNVSRTFGTAGICWDATGRLNPTNMCAGFLGIFGYSNATPTTDTNGSIAGMWLFADGAVAGQHVSHGLKFDFWKAGIIYDNAIGFGIDGSFVNGINFTGATVSGYQILGIGWSVDPSGNITTPTLILPHGSAPGSPINGQFWTTTASPFARINGATKTLAALETAQTWTELQTFSGGVSVNGGTLTVDTPVVFSQTWNNAGVLFNGLSIDITDTASSAISNLIRGTVGGVTRFSIRKDGIAAFAGVIAPAVYGGLAANSKLSLYATGGTGTTDSIEFLTGSLSLRWKIDTNGHWLAGTDNSYDIGTSGATRPRNVFVAGNITIGDATALVKSSVAMNNGAGAGAGTITNAPAAGDPTKWIPISDNGVTRYIPAW